jgi:Transposase IS66 family
LPLYRQARIFLRQGIALDHSTLGDWIGRACWWLRPVFELVVSHIMAAEKIFADDTGLPVLDPGRGRTKTSRFWCYAIDDRPWCGPEQRTAAAWSKWLNRYLNAKMCDDPKLVLYSLRHSYRQMLRAGNIGDDLADKIFGHSNGKVGTGYGKDLSPDEARLLVTSVPPPVDLQRSVKIVGPIGPAKNAFPLTDASLVEKILWNGSKTKYILTKCEIFCVN